MWIDPNGFVSGNENFRAVAEESPEMFAMKASSPPKFEMSGGNSSFLDQWDYLYTKNCRIVFEGLKSSQTISCTPGGWAITMKEYLPTTLRRAIGIRNMQHFIPQTFNLPYEKEIFLEHARKNGDALWVMKQDTHRRQGLAVMSGQLVAEHLQDEEAESPYRIAQKLISDQYCPLGNCSAYIRLWVIVVGGAEPTGVFQAYLWDGGYVQMSEELSEPSHYVVGSLPVNPSSQLTERFWTLKDVRHDLRENWKRPRLSAAVGQH